MNPEQQLGSSQRQALGALLVEAQRQGFVGPGPLGPHIDRALDMGAVLESAPSCALDLGSGAGLPGLPLALVWPSTRWVLLDASIRRTDFLRDAVTALGLAGRVEVVVERAESAGRGVLRSSVDVVMARSFAGPAVTAECASPFLRPGGVLVVAEPPEERPGRWDAEGVAVLGMRLASKVSVPTSIQVIRQVDPCPDRFPRRVGLPGKRPLF